VIVRAGTGWQYALADLSLILFLVTASALAQASGGKQAQPSAPPPPPIAAAIGSEPVAVWSASRDAPPLAQWLGNVGADPRLEVQVVVRYASGGREAAIAQANQLATAGGPRASAARILVEPGVRSGASVSLTYASETLSALPPLAR
jgi:hypothetical protein